MSRIIGIDLGTTNSEAAVMEGGSPKIIASAEGNVYGGKNFPSVVAFAKETGEVLVGDAAKRQAVLNAERTVLRIKRKMGSDYRVTIDDKSYSPQEVSALILRKIKHDAEQFLGEKVAGAVITVPAYFDDDQRQATKDAGKIAGLDVKRIVNEPTAAALAYGLDKDTDETIAVYDLGGGTFDITVMELGGGVFEVKSTNGDTQLGGSDMDDAVVEHLAALFQKQSGVNLRSDRSAMQRLRDAAERAKMELTSMTTTTVSLPFLAVDPRKGPQHFETTLNRAKLEELVRPLVERTRKPVEQALKDAKLGRDGIDKVVLVGGPTRMPIVQAFVEELFGKKPVRGVDPMQCVALGAAVQAGILSGEVDKDIVLLDVTPLTLGIETLGGVRTELIPRNTTIPHKKSQVFSTAADRQTQVEVHVLQGERPMARDNKSLGRFILDGIPPAPRGVPQVEVTFDIDANGILHVEAHDKGTGKKQKITVTGSTKLADKEVERMRKEAEEHAAEDAKLKEQADARNQADQALFQAEALLRDSGDKLGGHKEGVEEAVKELRAALEKADASAEDLKAATEAIHKALEPAVMEMYKHAATERAAAGATGTGAPGPGGEGSGWTGKPDGPGPGGKDDVVDAEFEEKDKGKGEGAKGKGKGRKPAKPKDG
ncbi:MAG TPA: molecular chaperone DnaK [Candidatus Thermoplasmatota archaeon]|nr:molecular chaperone DnaK [Candidatus Thermoplasmatota archaeon]